MPKTGPRPIFRFLNQSALDRIAVHVAQLLHPLLFVVNVEIVVPRLPEWPLPALNRHRQFQRLNCFAQKCFLWFTDQKVNMFRHDHISADHKIVTEAHGLQRPLEQAARRRNSEMRKTLITTECDEMKAAALLITNQTLRHPISLYPKIFCGKRSQSGFMDSQVSKSRPGAPSFWGGQTWATRQQAAPKDGLRLVALHRLTAASAGQHGQTRC